MHPEDNPVLERCSRLLMDPPKSSDNDVSYWSSLDPAKAEQAQYIVTSIVRALSMLSIADQDAVILIAERTLVVPALILLLARESCKLWGVWAEPVEENA